MQEEKQGFVWRGAGFSLSAQVPGCVSDALCAAGIVPPPDIGLNALRGEWAAAREWTLCGRVALPQGKERVFLCARGVHGAGVLLAAGREVGRFVPGDWEMEITEFIGAEADSVQIGLRFFARPAEGVPRRALVGVRGGLDAFGVNRLRFEDCYACAAVRDGVSTAEFRMTVRPFVPGRYTFRFAAVYGGETLVCREFAEDLRAVRTEIRKTLAVPSPRIWRAAEKNEPVWLRATVLSAGLVCDDHLTRTGFRTVETDTVACLSVNGERILLRGTRWQCGEPVAWERQKRRLEALRACRMNCLQTEGLAGDALLSWLDAHGMLCVCALPDDETTAGQIVRRAREHPCVVAYCGQSAAVCQALDGDRPFLRALYAPIGCAAVHGNVAALRGDADDAPFRAAREAVRCAGEGTDGEGGARWVENENREDGFSQTTETLPCLKIPNEHISGKVGTNETAHFATGGTSGDFGAGYSDVGVLRACAEGENRAEMHALQKEACPHFGNFNGNAEPLAVPVLHHMQAEALNEHISGKAGTNETAHFATGETCGRVGAGSSDVGVLRACAEGENRAEVHALQKEACPHFGNFNGDAQPLAAPISRYAQAESLPEYMHGKAGTNENAHFAAGETCGGINAGSSDVRILRACVEGENRAEMHALQNEAVFRFGSLNSDAETDSYSALSSRYMQTESLPEYMHGKAGTNETAHFATGGTSGGVGEGSSDESPISTPTSRFTLAETSRESIEDACMYEKVVENETSHFTANKVCSGFGEMNSGVQPFDTQISRFEQMEPLCECAENQSRKNAFPLPTETFPRFGIPNSDAETAPISLPTLRFEQPTAPTPRPEDTLMHEKVSHSEEAFLLPAETLRRFGILSSEAEALAAPISRYVQAETLRERVEDARMRGENILLAEPFETVESPRSAALFDGERPRPAFFALESALRPAHVCARMERTGYPCGAPMEAEIWLLYDAKTVPGPLRVSAALYDGTGREIERAVFDASPRTGVVGRFRAKMPDVPGALILRVRLDALGEMLDVSDTVVCAALSAPMWPLAHAPYAAVRIENGEIRNACARAAYGVACGGYLNPAWSGWGTLLPGECRAVRDETHAEALNMEPKMK